MSTPAPVKRGTMTLQSRARDWLVAQGYLTPTIAGEYELAQDGRDWLLWALWVDAGCPGMPAAIYSDKGR